MYYVNAYYIMDEAMGANDEDADLAFIVVDLKGKMDGKNEVSNSTITPTGTGVASATVKATNGATVSSLEAGKTYNLELTSSTASAKLNITLGGAVFADTNKNAQEVQFKTDKTATVQIIATGTTVTVKGA